MDEKKIDKIYKLIDKAEYEKAKEILYKIIEKDSDDIDAGKLLALCEVNLENYLQARNILEEVIKYRQDDAISWYYLGCCYDSLEQYPEAKHAYNEVIKLRSEYIDVYKSLSIVYIKSGEPQKAIDLIKEGLKYAKEEDYSLYYIAGTACMAAQKFDESIAYIEKAISMNSENVQLYNNLGTAYLTIGNYEKAFEAYKTSVEKNPSDSIAYFNIASILQMQGKHKEACEYFALAHKYEPQDDNYIIAWAVSELKSGMITEAIEHYKYLAASYPQKTTYKYNLACCLELVGEYEAAISILTQLVILKPKSVSVLKKLASIHIILGQLSQAKEIYEKIIRQGNVSYEVYYELALLCVKTSDLHRAEEILKKVCKLKPDFAYAHKDLGVIYLNKRLFDYAKSEFEQAYTYAPDDFSIVLEYANYFHAVSDFEQADNYYKKAISLEPHDTNALAFSALNKSHLNKVEEAKEQINHALEHSKESSFLYFVAGRIYFMSEDFENAKIYLVKSYELEKLTETQSLLALCYYNLGNYNQAKTIFSSMLEKAPLNINILLNMAKCCAKLEQKDEALKYLETITETFPECEEAQELIREIS